MSHTLFMNVTGLIVDNNGNVQATGKYFILNEDSELIYSGEVTTTDRILFDVGPGDITSKLSVAAMTINNDYDVNVVNITMY